MIVRIVNFIVIGALVLAASYVYRIKFDSTVQAERLAKLRGEVRQERDKIAALRAEWGELDNPARIETLAKRFLKLKLVAPVQYDSADHLPDQPPAFLRPGSADPIGGMIENLDDSGQTTGSVAPRAAPAADNPSGAPAQSPVVAGPPAKPPAGPGGTHR